VGLDHAEISALPTPTGGPPRRRRRLRAKRARATPPAGCVGSGASSRSRPTSWNLKRRIEVAAEGGVRGRTPPDRALRLDTRDGAGANAVDRRRKGRVSALTICPAASALSDPLPRRRFLHLRGEGASYRAVLRAPRRAGNPADGARLLLPAWRNTASAARGADPGDDGGKLAGDLARRAEHPARRLIFGRVPHGEELAFFTSGWFGCRRIRR
jgi:hypothetical protein